METRFLLLVLFVVSSASPGRALESTVCDLCLDGVCYGSNRLLSSSRISGHSAVAVDRIRDILYFLDRDDKTLKMLNLTDSSIESTSIVLSYLIDGLAVDQNTHDLFVQNSDDVLKYHPVSNQSILYLHHNFDRLFFKDKLYGICNISRVYAVENDQAKVFAPLRNIEVMFTDKPIIDKRGDFYFPGFDPGFCGTYKLQAGNVTPVEFSNKKEILLTTDRDDTAYFIYRYSDKRTFHIHRLDYNTNQLVDVGIFNEPLNKEIADVQFDKNNNMVFKYWIDVQIRKFNNNNVNELYHMKANSKRCRITKQIDVHGKTQNSVIEEL